jgi:hypothetical protein
VGQFINHLWQNKAITQLNGSIYYTSFSLSGVHLYRVKLNETYGAVSDKICLTLLLFKVVRRRVSLPPLFSTDLGFRFKDGSRKPEGISVERDTSDPDSRRKS